MMQMMKMMTRRKRKRRRRRKKRVLICSNTKRSLNLKLLSKKNKIQLRLVVSL
jgi:hypothetical protein